MVYDCLDLVIDATANELVLTNALQKGERDSSRAAVRGDIVFEINWSVRYFLLHFLPSFRRRGNSRDEQILLRADHFGDDIREVSKAADALHLGDFSELFGKALDLLQYLRRVDGVGNDPDHHHIIAAKKLAHLIVVVLLRVPLWQDAFCRAVNTDMPGVISK